MLIDALGTRLFQTPERGIWLHQFEAGVPGFMAAPDHLGLRLAARFRVDQPDAFAQREVRSHHSHAAGMAHVHGNRVGAFFAAALFPLYEKFNPRDDAFVAPQSFPSLLYGAIEGVWGNVDGHGRPHSGRSAGSGVEALTLVPEMLEVNSTFSTAPSRPVGPRNSILWA